MRIIFMGTPDFAVPSLERLVRDGHEVVLAVTQPDKPKGRGNQLTPPPVKARALALNIPVFQPVSMKTEETYETLAACRPDLIVVVAYGKILPQRVLDLPPHGCINVHASLLPRYRGAAPIQWAVLNGDAEAGVTTMKMEAGLDTGDMLLKCRRPLPADMTGESSTICWPRMAHSCCPRRSVRCKRERSGLRSRTTASPATPPC